MQNFMKFKIYDKECKIEWDETVKSFKDFDVHYLYHYNYAFYLERRESPYLFYYNYKQTRAIYVFILRDLYDVDAYQNHLPKGEYFDIISPYGYGGFLVEGDNYVDVFKTFEEYCKANKIVSSTTRLNLFNSKEQLEFWPNFSPFNNVVRSLDLNSDQLLQDFNYDFRKNLKSSFNKNLKLVIDTNKHSYKEFINIYNATMDRTNAQKHYYFSSEFYETLNQMTDNVVYFNVYFENKMISSELILYGRKYCYSFLGGTDKDYFNLHPNHFLKYHIMMWAKDVGLSFYILGGGLGEDGIFSYKKGMAPKGIVPFYISSKIMDEERYNFLLHLAAQIRSNEAKINFFPGYRDL